MRYESAAALRVALETRLNSEAARPEGLTRLRKMAAFERFLARIQAQGDERWLLKGGFALQLRLGRRARVTKDIDLGANLALIKGAEAEPEAIGEALADRASRDAGDFFVFRVRSARELELSAGPVQAYRYPVDALLAGRPFETFHVDAGIGDPLVAPAVDLPGSGIFDFAGLPRPVFKATRPEQHFAEKVHALTRTREGTENSRTRDLVDLVLLLDFGLPGPADVRAALEAIFRARKTHPLPPALLDPPRAWEEPYARLAGDLGLRETTVASAMSRLRTFWAGLGWPAS